MYGGLPIAVAHGEGFANFKYRGDAAKAIAAMRFVDNMGAATEAYPFNPNGSPAGLTAVTSADGRYDVIVLSGSVAEIPDTLLSMLAIGGRLIAIVGDDPVMRTTIVTRDGKPSAHFEHTIAVRNGKAEVLSTFSHIESVLKERGMATA